MKGDSIVVSDHAVERYIERVRPGATAAVAQADLVRLAGFGTWRKDRPPWVSPDSDDAAAYIEIGNVALPLSRAGEGRWLVRTCLVNTLGPLAKRTKQRHIQEREAGVAEGR